MLRAIICTALVVCWASPALAACHWEWVCDAQGRCSNVPVCTSTLDIVPIQPPSLKPIVPPAIQPIQRPILPPLGTKRCTQVRRWNGTTWGWSTVCQ